MNLKKRPWALAIVYVVVSLVVEAGMMIIGHLRVPQDNAILAPVVMTVPPVLAAWLGGYRRLREWIMAAVLLSVLTFLITAAFGRVTGIHTGLLEPIINRALAGFLAGVIANRVEGGP